VLPAGDMDDVELRISNSTLPPAGSTVGAVYHKLYTQYSAPEDGRNYRPMHVELIEIINNICYCCIRLVVYIIVSIMHGYTDIKHTFYSQVVS